ncbi:MAG: mechanosensitive ion channel family protein [Methanomicrobiales archaeon]|nr:mechanosensitive ion channel family protein [Methanomicrobiales archaeon]
MDFESAVMGIGIILLGIIGAVVTYAICSMLMRRADQTSSKLDDILVFSFRLPLTALILVASAYFALTHYFVVPPAYAWIIGEKAVTSGFIFFVTWFLSAFLQQLVAAYGQVIAARTQTDVDDQILTIFEYSIRYIVWFLGLLFILATLELDITPLIAGAGIAGLAVALAAQEILANIFAGTIILTDQPLKVHDRVRIGEYFGDVVHIGFRSTRLMTVDYQLVTIPNSTITNSIIVNYAMPDIKMLVVLDFPVAYGSDVEKVMSVLKSVVNKAAREIDYILEDPAPIVLFWEFGESSLNFKMKVWTNDCKKEIYLRSHINREVNRRFIEEGIEIPFTQVDVHMKS